MGAWYDATISEENPPDPDSAWYYRELFPQIGNGDPKSELTAFGRLGDKRRWTPLDGYFRGWGTRVRGRGGTADTVLWPLLGFQLRVPENSDVLELTIRLVLYATDDAGFVDAWGWRFDSPDSDGDGSGSEFHPYYHVQHISRWERGSHAFQPPGFPPPLPGGEEHFAQRPKSMPETRPAFPIPCRSPSGMVMAAMVSIYGPRPTSKVVEAIASLHLEFQSLAGAPVLDFVP